MTNKSNAASSTQPQGQSAITPLTYEQEVHAILCASKASVEDLLRYFKAQASQEKGDAKKLTQKCIDWKRDDLRRIAALIPQALERRELAASRTVEQPLNFSPDDLDEQIHAKGSKLRGPAYRAGSSSRKGK